MELEDIIKEKSLDPELIDYVQKKLDEKGINIETQDEVIKYLWANKKLFGHIIDTKKLADKIIQNLDKSITYFGTDTTNLPAIHKSKFSIITSILSMSIIGGYYQPYSKEVYLNPLTQGKLTKWGRRNRDSIFMHEIDHCATTSYTELSEKDMNEFIEYKTKKGILGKIISNTMPNRLNDYIVRSKKSWDKMIDGKIAAIGVDDPLLEKKYNISFSRLNEGITVLKQKKFSKVLGLKFSKITSSSYMSEPFAAEFIAEKIGLDNLIKFQQENDYESINKSFKEATGKDLKNLIIDLNKIPILIPFTKGMLRKMLHLKQYESIVAPNKKNADFVPKFKLKAIDKPKETIDMPKTKTETKENDSEYEHE